LRTLLYRWGKIYRSGSCITASTSLSGDPLTGLLKDNTGPTKTHALLDGSQVINHIPAGSCTVAEDRFRYTRSALKDCDIGAFE